MSTRQLIRHFRKKPSLYVTLALRGAFKADTRETRSGANVGRHKLLGHSLHQRPPEDACSVRLGDDDDTAAPVSAWSSQPNPL
jgi:hypothetical protein